ncbi:MAG TPA: MFS transporter [Orrella sp.]
MSQFKQFISPWYLGYAFQGAAVLGLAPILLPLVVGGALGSSAAGMVVACFYVGQLASPLLGNLADRTKAFRLIYALGYVLLAAGLSGFALVESLVFWSLLAFVQGLGSAATNTVAAMFIVEYSPKKDWDGKIGWLQTFYGAGQAAGLGLAAIAQAHPTLGLLLSAALMAPGLFLGLRGLPDTGRSGANTHTPLRQRTKDLQAKAARLISTGPRNLSHLVHRYHPQVGGLVGGLLKNLKTPYGLYILAWFACMFGTWLLYNLYPLLMKSAFDIEADRSSLFYALAAVIGVFFYAPSGKLGKLIGDVAVVALGTIVTLICLLAMSMLAWWQPDDAGWWALLAFIPIPVAWSPLIVAGTAAAAQLSSLNEGKAVGIFNATTAIASVLSAFAAGWVADLLSYTWVLILAAIATAIACVLLMPLLKQNKSGQAGSTDDESAA